MNAPKPENKIKEGHKDLFPLQLTPLSVHTNGSARYGIKFSVLHSQGSFDVRAPQRENKFLSTTQTIFSNIIVLQIMLVRPCPQWRAQKVVMHNQQWCVPLQVSGQRSLLLYLIVGNLVSFCVSIPKSAIYIYLLHSKLQVVLILFDTQFFLYIKIQYISRCIANIMYTEILNNLKFGTTDGQFVVNSLD